jgi:hypothetical protein
MWLIVSSITYLISPERERARKDAAVSLRRDLGGFVTQRLHCVG